MKKKNYGFLCSMTIGLCALVVNVHASEPITTNTSHFVNVNGYSVTEKGELVKFTEFVVKDDLIHSIGKSVSLSDNIPKIDLAGKTVLPGLIDSHGHILGLGASLLKVDLRGSNSEAEAVNRVLQFVSRASKVSESDSASANSQRWIVGDGWNQVLWPNQVFPSKGSLDRAIKDVPVMLNRVDNHAVWVNSKALSLAGIDRNTPSPSGGEIVKDAAGEPTGLLIDNAVYLVTDKISKPTIEEKSEYLAVASEHLVALGITSVHDAGISKQERDFYISQAQKKALKFRIYAMLAATDPAILSMLKEGHFNSEDNFLSIRSIKAYGDGALGSRGAALLAPYSDDPTNSGLLVTPQERLPSLFNTVIGANFQLNFHAIGDRANRLALQQFGDSFTLFPENAQRHRIEHAQVVAVEDIELFTTFDVIASMQPTHATSDMNMAEDRVGKARLRGAYAWQTLLKQGSRIALGSDFPVELANAFHGLHAAVSRQNAEQQPSQGWIASERLTRVEALKGFTIDGAYAAFQDKLIGSLEAGKKADFIIIDKDYFEVPTKDIRDIQVLSTYINGKLVFVR